MGDTQPTGQVIWSSSNEDVIVVDSLTSRVIVGPGGGRRRAGNAISADALLVVLRAVAGQPAPRHDLRWRGHDHGPGGGGGQGGAPAAWFSSPNPAIYTIDSATGLLTAVSPAVRPGSSCTPTPWRIPVRWTRLSRTPRAGAPTSRYSAPPSGEPARKPAP
jgi:hypothetical protein